MNTTRSEADDLMKLGVALALGYVALKYVLPLLKGAADAADRVGKTLAKPAEVANDVRDAYLNAKWFYRSGQPITLLDGARVRLETINNASLDRKQGIFLYQARLYQILGDGKSAKLAPQGARVTLALDGGKETYVQGPRYVQVLVSK